MGFERDPRYRLWARQAAERSAAIIGVSRAIGEEIARTFPGVEERIRVIGNGFDRAVFHPAAVGPDLREIGVVDPSQPLVVFAGKFTRFKGIDTLLDAAAIYERSSPPLTTLLVGHGDLREELEARTEQLGLERIHFLGHRPQNELAGLFAAASVAVFPSRTEPFGLVALEALACGTPVVATDAGGLPDFINEEVGALVPVDDAEALASAIVNEASRKAAKGPVASRYASEGFSWASRVARTIDVYEEALATGV